MSEQKLVSPLLDGFQMGAPISSHDGVCCCPAIKENSDNKYIVKILSIPASQSQLDALLLTGAFQDAAGALDYFKDLADGVVREAQLHQQLARLEGFVPCEAWQVVPMDDNQLGYDVYLLTPYRRTLERHLKKNTLTHLEAVNLGLDICAALAVCRRAGYIYVDLKPSNIFISDDREYLIGDLGFMSMDSLKYAALPSKYRSRYSAPELHDVFATISDTADIYALGLILYQIYNDNQLPFETQPPAEELLPPANADYEMAEIILKACHPDPAQRWQDPTQMGQALVAYMQRNTINDVPIIPPVAEDLTAEPAEEEAAAEEPAEETAPVAEEEAAPGEEAAEAEVPTETVEAPAVQAEAEPEAESAEDASEELPAEENTGAEPEAASAEQDEEDAPAAENGTPEEEAAPAGEESDEEADELALIEEMVCAEDADEADEDIQLENMTEEVSAILAQADELASHEIPEPVVVTAPKLPEEEPEAEAPAPEEAAPAVAEEIEEDDGADEVDIPIPIPDLTPKKKTGRKWLVTLIVIALLAGLGYGANYYYQNYYLIPVESIVLDGSSSEITADIKVDFDESKLTAVCTDTYGNTVSAPVVNGQAQFTGLNPGTQYTVSLKVEGFNQLTGSNAASFTTTQQTNIVSISATTGAEDGSVILSLTVDGTDPGGWTVEYSTEGEEPQTMAFTGHVATITGLTTGSTYTFRLMPTEETDIALVGTDTLEFTVSKVILAQNVSIASFEDGVMTIRWSAPEDSQVGEWSVRCTGDGYDETYIASETTAQFSGIETGKTYSLEILAEGMTQSARTDVVAQPLTISGVAATIVNDKTLRITWEYQGEAPAAGWQVDYSIDGTAMDPLTSDTNAADLSMVIPGAAYEITVQAAGAASGVSTTFNAPAAGQFSGHDLSAGDLSYSLCATPAASGWNHRDVTQYGSSFSAGQSVSMVVYSSKKVVKDSAEIQVLYVVRDSSGKLLPDLCTVQTMNWKSMWKETHYFYPTLPKSPGTAGTYTFEIYFNGALAISKDFKIVN